MLPGAPGASAGGGAGAGAGGKAGWRARPAQEQGDGGRRRQRTAVMPNEADSTAAGEGVSEEVEGVDNGTAAEEEVPARVPASIAETDRLGARVVGSLRLVVSVAMFALLVAVIGIGIRDGLELAVYQSGAASSGFDNVLFNVNVIAREPVIVRYENNYSIKEMTQYGLQGWIPSICFFPVCLIALLKCAPKVVIGQALGMLVSYTVLLVGYGVFQSFIVFVMSPCIVLGSAYISLYCVMPPKSELPWLVLRWLAINITYLIVVIVSDAFLFSDGVTDEKVALQLCIILPLVREFARYNVVKATWRCTYGATNSLRIDMQRNRVWPLFSAVQMTGAMVSRMAQSGVSSPAFQVGIIIYTASLEIALRLTVLERDEWIRNLVWRYGSRRRSNRVHSAIIDVRQAESLRGKTSQVNAEATDVEAPTRGQYFETRRAFFSDLIIVEMVGEYVGIFVTPILIIVWRSRPLLAVFSYYNNSPNEVFDGQIALWPLVLSAGLQFLAEVLVDTICSLSERAHGLTLAASWEKLRSRGNLFFLLFTWATIYSLALTGGLNRVQRQYDYQRCTDTDLCYCMTNNSQDLLRSYCELLYPPDGIPLNNSLYPPPPLL